MIAREPQWQAVGLCQQHEEMLMEYEHTNNSAMTIILVIINVNRIIIIMMRKIMFSHIMLPGLIENVPCITL